MVNGHGPSEVEQLVLDAPVPGGKSDDTERRDDCEEKTGDELRASRIEAGCHCPPLSAFYKTFQLGTSALVHLR
jgi:hypothetical protein